jgi:hypothetical protein
VCLIFSFIHEVTGAFHLIQIHLRKHVYDLNKILFLDVTTITGPSWGIMDGLIMMCCHISSKMKM